VIRSQLINGENLECGGQTNIVVYIRVLANQEHSISKVDVCKNENDAVDV